MRRRKRRLLSDGVKPNALGEYLDTLLGPRCAAGCGLRVFPRDLERHLVTGGECDKTCKAKADKEK